FRARHLGAVRDREEERDPPDRPHEQPARPRHGAHGRHHAGQPRPAPADPDDHAGAGGGHAPAMGGHRARLRGASRHRRRRHRWADALPAADPAGDAGRLLALRGRRPRAAPVDALAGAVASAGPAGGSSRLAPASEARLAADARPRDLRRRGRLAAPPIPETVGGRRRPFRSSSTASLGTLDPRFPENLALRVDPADPAPLAARARRSSSPSGSNPFRKPARGFSFCDTGIHSIVHSGRGPPRERQRTSVRTYLEAAAKKNIAPRRAADGFLLLDASLRPLSFNAEAIQVLGYPDTIA